MASEQTDAAGRFSMVRSQAPRMVGGVLRRVLVLAVEGVNGFAGAKSAAASALDRHGDVEKAIEALTTQHIALAGAQGILSNLGGFVTMVITAPANLAGLAVVQARMVASIAHLRGYDVDDERVRTAIAMCLVADSLERLLASRGLPHSPLVVATAPVVDAELGAQISDRIGTELVTRISGKKLALVFMAKRIPLVGGGVGGAFDGWDTWTIARYARRELVPRRRG